MAFSSFARNVRMGATSIFYPATKVDESSNDLSVYKIPVQSSMTRLPSVSTTCSESPKHYASQDEISSTDASDDEVGPVFADLTSSDSEHGDDFDTPMQTCVFSVMMLLRLRASCCDDDESQPAVRYGTRYICDLPEAKPKHSKPCQGSSAASWRQPAEKLPEAAADSWVAQQRKSTPDDDARVVRAARSILNKLTIEKFEPLLEQLTDCGIQEPHHISILMKEIFEKATIQHHFIPMYADLCVRLEKHPSIAAAVKESGDSHSFRRLLLNQCQIVFEQVLEPMSEVEKTDIDEEMLARRKERALGNMKLIGQLLTHGMLSSDLFVHCCEELLRNRTRCSEALEALVALIMVAGPNFDRKSWQFYSRLEKVFSDMKALTKDKPTPPRIRFLIRDVLDARAADWPHSIKAKAPSEKAEMAPDVSVNEKSESKANWRPVKGDGSKGNAKAEIGKQSSPAAKTETAEESFDVIAFRRTLAVVLNDLASDKNIPAAVQRIRAAQVPVKVQSSQFADIITRVVEERRGAVRRTQLAFIAGLAAAESSAFERKECLVGLKSFFQDIYNDLCTEVLRLPSVMKSEFMPTMLNSFSKEDLNDVVPVAMRQ